MTDEKKSNLSAEGGSPGQEGLVQDSRETHQEDSENAMLEMLEDLPNEGAGSKAEDIQFEGAKVGKAEFQQLSQTPAQGKISSIDLLLDVNLPVSIELGRTTLTISEILSLGPGSVVELARLAGEPVDVMINHKLVARGEVVVVDENFGVRITQLITPQERLRLLGEA
jgi:flagellar motor switch protein FliN/FliY